MSCRARAANLREGRAVDCRRNRVADPPLMCLGEPMESIKDDSCTDRLHCLEGTPWERRLTGRVFPYDAFVVMVRR